MRVNRKVWFETKLYLVWAAFFRLRIAATHAIVNHRNGIAKEVPMTARSILESRLGRPLGPIATMPRDLRVAMYRLALQLVKTKGGKPKSVRDLMAR
jgi:hypothetical protein